MNNEDYILIEAPRRWFWEFYATGLFIDGTLIDPYTILF